MKEVLDNSMQGQRTEIRKPTFLTDPAVGASERGARVDAKPDSSRSKAPWEERLMHRLVGELSGYLFDIAGDIKVPSEFLAALTANESGGDPRATRFEPGVYQHLKSVAEGRVASYGSIAKSLLENEIQRESAIAQAADQQRQAQMTGHPLLPQAGPSAQPGGDSSAHTETGGAALPTGDPRVPQAGTHAGTQPSVAKDAPSDEHQPSASAKAESYHAAHLTVAFAATSAPALSGLEDAAIRRLATSWGLTQIMGYHMLGRPEPVEKLCDPAFHYRIAAQMIEEFAAHFHLDPQRDFEALFRCWNTGRPDGKTFDPSYAEKGMRRIAICRQLLTTPAPGH